MNILLEVQFLPQKTWLRSYFIIFQQLPVVGARLTGERD
jgi:hypothetical protein